MSILEKAKAHLATYGAAHTDCCGTPLIRELVVEVERLVGAAECDAWRQGIALCTDYDGTSMAPRKYHMHPNGVAIPRRRGLDNHRMGTWDRLLLGHIQVGILD